jgi:hypothetical protein
MAAARLLQSSPLHLNGEKINRESTESRVVSPANVGNAFPTILAWRERERERESGCCCSPILPLHWMKKKQQGNQQKHFECLSPTDLRGCCCSTDHLSAQSQDQKTRSPQRRSVFDHTLIRSLSLAFVRRTTSGGMWCRERLLLVQYAE